MMHSMCFRASEHRVQSMKSHPVILIVFGKARNCGVTHLVQTCTMLVSLGWYCYWVDCAGSAGSIIVTCESLLVCPN